MYWYMVITKSEMKLSGLPYKLNYNHLKIRLNYSVKNECINLNSKAVVAIIQGHPDYNILFPIVFSFFSSRNLQTLSAFTKTPFAYIQTPVRFLRTPLIFYVSFLSCKCFYGNNDLFGYINQEIGYPGFPPAVRQP